MEAFGEPKVVMSSSNVVYLSRILGNDDTSLVHKCDWKCQTEHLCGNMYRCKVTGIEHICDKTCNQRIVYDNHSSFCLVNKKVFPLTQTEEQAVRCLRRKIDSDAATPESCSFKRRRDA